MKKCALYTGKYGTISDGSGYEAAIITRVRAAWGKFRKMLPILSCKTLSRTTGGRIYTHVRSVILYSSECWPLKRTNLSQLKRNERSMLWWLCHIKLENNCSHSTLCNKLGLIELSLAIRQRHLQWKSSASILLNVPGEGDQEKAGLNWLMKT